MARKKKPEGGGHGTPVRYRDARGRFAPSPPPSRDDAGRWRDWAGRYTEPPRRKRRKPRPSKVPAPPKGPTRGPRTKERRGPQKRPPAPPRRKQARRKPQRRPRRRRPPAPRRRRSARAVVRDKLTALHKAGRATDLVRITYGDLELRARPVEGTILRGLAGAALARERERSLAGMTSAERSRWISEEVRRAEDEGELEDVIGVLDGEGIQIEPEGEELEE